MNHSLAFSALAVILVIAGALLLVRAIHTAPLVENDTDDLHGN